MAFLVFNSAASRFHTDKRTGEQPRVIQLSWWRSDEPEPICALILPPPGTTIDPSTIPYHGLVLTDLERDGQEAADVIRELEKAALNTDAIISFNEEFHWRQLHRLMGVPSGSPRPATAVDAMALATPILAIPAMRPGGGLKMPSLRECCRFFDIPEPLTAESDPLDLAESTVRAIRGVYEECLAHGQPSAA